MAEVDLLGAIEKPGEPIVIKDTPEEPKVETPVETPPVSEEPKEEVKTPEEPKVETPKEEVVAPKEEPKEVPEYLKKWNELSGGKFTFDKDEDIKTFFETHEQISSEYEGLKGISEKMAEIENFVKEKGKAFDPVAIVGGEENYKKMFVANALVNKSTDRKVQNIAIDLVSSDLDKIDDLDFLSQLTQLQTPKLAGKDKIAKEVILAELGVDTTDLDLNNLELDDKQMGRLAIKAAEGRNKIRTSIEKVEVPKAVNPINDIITKFDQEKEKSEELKVQWKEAETPFKESLTKLDFPDYGFEFEIKEDVTPIINEYLNSAARKGIEPNEANKQKVLTAIQEEIWSRDRKKILAAMKTHIEATVKAELEKKYENREPLSTPSTPVLTDEQSTAQGKYKTILGL